MFRALNESSNSGDEGECDLEVAATREAQEEEAYSMYNTALRSHYEGNLDESEAVFIKILALEFISQVQPPDESENKNPKEEKLPLCPALNLKYLVLKNLASISSKKKSYEDSVSYYLKALDIDATDVNTWFRTGITANNLPNYSLARHCFEEALNCNQSHWPSLDNVITVTYALNAYANCLYHISKALELEPCYLKGLALKDKIYKEDPFLKRFCECYFEKCDPSIHYATYDEDEALEIIEEALKLREKNRSLRKPVKLPELKLTTKIKESTWKAVGESLVDTYDYFTNADPAVSLSCKIDLSDYLNPDKKDDTDSETSARNANSSSEVTSSSNGKHLKMGLLQVVSQESSADKEDDSPNVSGMSLISNSYLETAAVSENELRPSEAMMYIKSDAPLGNKKTSKRKRSLLSELTEFCGKRRSTRTRTPAVKRPQDSINYQEILQQFLPPRLIGEGNYDEQDNECFLPGKNFGDHTYGQVAHGIYNDAVKGMKDVNSLATCEKKDMDDFISEYQNNGLLDLMYKYVTKLGAKSNFAWPKALPDVFSAAFIRLRKHITMPNLFCHDTDRRYTRDIGFAVLTFSELKVDQWYLGTGHSASSSTSFSPKMPSAANSSFQIGPDFIGKNFHADMEFLMQLTVCNHMLESDWLQFTIRALWLKAKFHSVEGEVDMAVSCMEKLADLLQKECQPDLKVVVLNSYFSNVITLETVNQQLELLQRCLSLEEIQRLYESGSYQSVVDLLIPTFGPTHSKPKVSAEGSIPERHAQLMLLQDSLWKMENYQECVRWTEVAFKESIQQYMNATPSSVKNDWIDTMSHLLMGLERCAKANKIILNSLEQSRLIRLTQNLILVVCLQMESYEISMDSSLSVLPWIILYHLIYGEECLARSALESLKDKDPSIQGIHKGGKVKNELGATDSESDSSAMPSSLMLLITAHECLGRRSCCSAADGLFLLHCVDVFMKEVQEYSNKPQSYREEIETAIEQAFYCLYGHPHKRNKAKHLQEHGSQQLPIIWEKCFQIYQYFTPSILPEFDSYKASTVSAELENLLKRIAAVVPPELDPSSRVDAYSAYIEGGTDKCPVFPADSFKPNIVTRDLYYLLGDYYFKNKEFSRAIRYYLLDVCINPDRLDSWAGMALSRSSQLDQKLNSYEVRNESAIWRKSSAALRCFEHALQINSSTNSLWIEYGSLAYVLHSHASRQLKLNTYFDGPRELLKVKKDEMLLLAERCFKEANKCVGSVTGEPEEAWLHHYMLGKIAQKFDQPPSLFLEHYQKSLQYIHEDHARYPHKIQYHNPPNLSIEVLEVFYRIHASCLKYLSKYENSGMPLHDIKAFRDCLSAVAAGPFATFQEKVYEDCSPAESEGENFIEPDDVAKSSAGQNEFEAPLEEPKKADEDSGGKLFDDEVHQKPEPYAVDVIEWLINTVEKGQSVYSSVVNNEVSLQRESVENSDAQNEEQNIEPAQSSAVEKGSASFLAADDSFKSSEALSAEPSEPMDIESEVAANTVAKENDYLRFNIDISDSEVSNARSDVLVIVTDNCSSDDSCSNQQESDSCVGLSPSSMPSREESKEMDDIVKTLNEILAIVISTNDCVNSGILDAIKDVTPHNVDGNVGNLTSSASSKRTEVQKECELEPITSALTHTKEIEPQLPSEKGDKLPGDSLTSSKNHEPIHGSTESELSESQKKKTTRDKSPDESELQQSKIEIDGLISDCLNGLRECLKRFIQHYKSLYRIAYHYCYSGKSKNLQWSREVLLAATPAVKNYPAMPGLFAERKNTNFFNGIWRAPSNEIDRPGSFGAHMYRSVRLLIDVLSKQNDYNMLLYLTQQLYRTPDLGKKYMRDVERISLTRLAYDSCITILREQMNSLLQEEPPPEESRLTCCLLEIYRTFQTLLKGGIYIDDTNELLEEAYTMYKLGEVDQYPAVLEQAVRFCQLQLGKSYQVGHEPARYSSSAKQSPVISDVVGEGCSKMPNSVSLYTPDAWQRGKR